MKGGFRCLVGKALGIAQPDIYHRVYRLLREKRGPKNHNVKGG